MSQTPIVISIGGSLVVPKDGIAIDYLRELNKFIRGQVKAGRRFIIVIGGGYTARQYQNAAKSIAKLHDDDADWLGIHATRLNAQLIRTVFKDIANPRVNKDPTKRMAWTEPLLIAAGWKPGWSTDYVAVRLARKYGAKRVINLTNIDAVYDKDPARFDDAVAVKRIAWKDFRKIVGDVWSPGANAPFDPIASKLAQKWGLEAVIASGHDLKNVKAIVDGKKFKGTLIDGE
ncbi:UMP kinase [Candidatus Uhrbacteria bacterium]|nr:UMP kinase [Candidatus Uhrbacteria bacterium]